MATRFMCKALSTTALIIALSPLLAATTTTSPAWSNTAGPLQLDPPAAPSNCRARTSHFRDPRFDDYTEVSWRDNSTNEDGFTVEVWWRNQSREWIMAWSESTAADSTQVVFIQLGSNYKFRVKAFNASGDSAWSNWAH